MTRFQRDRSVAAIHGLRRNRLLCRRAGAGRRSCKRVRMLLVRRMAMSAATICLATLLAALAPPAKAADPGPNGERGYITRQGEPVIIPAPNAGGAPPKATSQRPTSGPPARGRPMADMVGIASGIQPDLVGKIHDLGLHRVRIDFTWNDIQKNPRTWQWGAYDDFVDTARANGIEILGILDYGVPWANKVVYPPNGKENAPPDRFKDFTNYAEAVVKRYQGKIKAYEIWNEPNNGGVFWASSDLCGPRPSLPLAPAPGVSHASLPAQCPTKGIDDAPRWSSGKDGDPRVFADLTVATMNAIRSLKLGAGTPLLAPGATLYLDSPLG